MFEKLRRARARISQVRASATGCEEKLQSSPEDNASKNRTQLAREPAARRAQKAGVAPVPRLWRAVACTKTSLQNEREITERTAQGNRAPNVVAFGARHAPVCV